MDGLPPAPPMKVQIRETASTPPAPRAFPSPMKNAEAELPYELVWSDEFDYEGLPDARKWSYQVESNNWVHDRNHNEQQWYMSGRRENSYVSGGTLKLNARREDWIGNPYTSARIRTRGKGDWLYGRMEVRAKLPAGRRGIWPAIWLMPTDQRYGGWPRSGEVDLMECVGWAPGVVHNSVHTGAFNHRKASHKHAETLVADAHDAFHVYGCEWDERSIKYFIDDRQTFEFKNTGSGNPDEWPFDQRFYIILNVAVGGNWGAKEGIDDAALPTAMEIDYVRMYQRGGAAAAAAASAAGPPPPPAEIPGGTYVPPKPPQTNAPPPPPPAPTPATPPTPRQPAPPPPPMVAPVAPPPPPSFLPPPPPPPAV